MPVAPPASPLRPPLRRRESGPEPDRRGPDAGSPRRPDPGAAAAAHGPPEAGGARSTAPAPVPPPVLRRLMEPLEHRFGASRVGLWLGGGSLLGLDPEDGVLTLRAPHRFAADRLAHGGLADALDAAAAEAGLPPSGEDAGRGHLRLRVDDASGPGCGRPERRRAATPGVLPPRGPARSGSGPGSRSTPRSAAEPTGDGQPAPRTLRGPDHRLDTFVTGGCNELAHAAAVGLAAGDHDGPLFLHGGCGLGKTHLLNGVVAAWREGRSRREAPSGRVYATTGERFTNRFIDHARRGDLAAFRREVRGCALLAVDDVHFIAGKDKTQHELLHCFDAALAAGVPVVFASDRHPRELSAMGTALSSRCLQGLVAELTPPDAATRRRLIRELGRRRGLRIDEAGAAALEPLAGPGVREIEGLLAKLDVLGRLTGTGTGAGASARPGAPVHPVHPVHPPPAAAASASGRRSPAAR